MDAIQQVFIVSIVVLSGCATACSPALVNRKVAINRATAVVRTTGLSEIESNRRTSLHGRMRSNRCGRIRPEAAAR
jgi:hypothetical protein